MLHLIHVMAALIVYLFYYPYFVHNLCTYNLLNSFALRPITSRQVSTLLASSFLVKIPEHCINSVLTSDTTPFLITCNTTPNCVLGNVQFKPVFSALVGRLSMTQNFPAQILFVSLLQCNFGFPGLFFLSLVCSAILTHTHTHAHSN